MAVRAGVERDFTVRTTSRRELILKLTALAGLVYLFILSITLLGDAFKLFGKDFAETIFHATSNPVIGLMIGLITTSIIQSSSTTTSIIVGLVASGVLSFESSVPMVMGANIGTSVTNIIVSLGHINRGDEFKRAFCGSLLHDFFNICSVIVLLPLQIYFNIIGSSAVYLESVFSGFGGLKFTSPLKATTGPVAEFIIHLTNRSGWLSALVALLLLFIALRYIVVVLKSMVLAKVEKFFQRYIFRTPVLGFLLGVALTTLVQSSSITTSIVVPLIGAGVITIPQIYPYLLGANIGTTITAFLASFVTGSHQAVAVAFAHLMFNVFGIFIFWPLKVIPIWLARTLSEFTQKSRLVPIAYIVVVFFLIPGIIIYLYR
ncbi:MAG TPA: Na/Pi symporter [candidate division Zixibacteria bacterium]|nr:Na/Pi symporter [candidate division Zixibacteria bacterium]